MFSISAPENSYPHHPSFTAAAGTDKAHEEAVLVGKSLALIGWDLVTDGQMLRQAQLQWEQVVAAET